MRAERIIQASIFDIFAGHGETGRRGLPAELALRCGLLKQHRQLSYEELAFHLEDSSSFRAFARLPLSWTPKKSVLHKTISAIRAETWEAINRTVLASAREERLEPGRMVRLDSTVTAALMHEPSDSSLLWDAVRVMVRLLQAADALIGGAGVPWRDHSRAAKKRARAIEFTRGRPNRVPHYRELVRLTRATLVYLDQASTKLATVADPRVVPGQAERHHYRPLIERIIRQTAGDNAGRRVGPDPLVSAFTPSFCP